MLGRIMKIFISSILQRRPRIFKESFLLGRIIKPFFQFCKKDTVYLRGLFLLGRKIRIFFFLKSAKLFGPFLIVYYSLKNQPRQLPWLPWW